MYIASVPNRNSPPAILLRQSLRQGAKIVKHTLANLSSWPAAQIDSLRRVLKGESLVAPSDAFHILRSAPHGHVAAALGTLRRLLLEPILSRSPGSERNLVVAMIVARILEPSSKLATSRGFHPSRHRHFLAAFPARSGCRHRGNPALSRHGLAALAPTENRKRSRQTSSFRGLADPLRRQL